MAIKEVVRERARQAAREYRETFIGEQKEKYEKAVREYEALLTEQYQLEFRLDFLQALDKGGPPPDKRDREELKQRQIVFLKKIKDIENSGALEGYDAVMEAIRTVDRQG